MTKKRKRVLFWVILLIFIVGIGIVVPFFYPTMEEINPNGSRPAVFFSPHPDDETLNMGVTIAKHVRAGRPVYIVLLTHGRESGALGIINKSLEIQQKNSDIFGPINRDQLEVARIREIYNASRALGVPENHLFVEYLDKGRRAITYQETKKVTKKYIQMFPDADFFSLSWVDIHYDHRVSARALYDLYMDGTVDKKVSNVYFFISMATRMYLEKKKIVPPGVEDRAYSYGDQARVRKAMKAYNEWNPKRGSYAIGYNSVSRQFKKLNRNMYHYVHGIDIKQLPEYKFGE